MQQLSKDTLHSMPPTGRLALHALAASPTPLTVAHLSELTGSTPSHLERTLRTLVRRGVVNKLQGIGHISTFSLVEQSVGGAK
jgi:predicted transcriptional regulator